MKLTPVIYPVVLGELVGCQDELKKLGRTEDIPLINVKAVRTGEFREPKKGEWYLSGAIAEAYRARNDLSMKFNICKLVLTRTRTIVEIVEGN
jgi:hypothetical protein